MTKKWYLMYIAVFFMFSGTSVLSAMPPHPDLIKKYRDQGEIDILMKKIQSSSLIIKRSLPAKSAPASGTMRIPVLLVLYGTPYDGAAAAPPAYHFIPFLPSAGAGLAGILSLLFFVFFVRRKGPVWMNAAFSAAVLAVFLSCGTDPDKYNGGFQTDKAVYDEILNSVDGSALSVRKYYRDMSGNSLDVVFDIYGPVQVSKSWDYYGENDGAGNDSHPGELVGEALRLMTGKYNNTVDFSRYDNDNDGNIDSVIIIHDGPGEEVSGEADTIWSHQWDLASAHGSMDDGTGPVRADGVWFNIYTIQPEYTFVRGDSTPGVFAHEFGHVLGLPDQYDTGYTTSGVGVWSIMGAGSWGSAGDGADPAPLTAWERYRAGGSSWISVTEITNATGGALSIDDVKSSGIVYKVMLDSTVDEEQYFLIEGRKQASVSDWYVPGSGLLISHIHEGVISSYLSDNEINLGDARIHGVNIVEADGGGELWSGADTGSAGDLYDAGDSLSGADTNYYTDNVNYTLAKDGESNVSITVISASTSFPVDLTVSVP